MAWPLATYDVISRNHSNLSYQTGVKMCPRDMPTATENGRWWWKIVLEKFKENLIGGGGIPLYTLGLITIRVLSKWIAVLYYVSILQYYSFTTMHG